MLDKEKSFYPVYLDRIKIIIDQTTRKNLSWNYQALIIGLDL